jgi:hypothetical protein
MRSTPAVDNLILWHAAAILVLAWLIVAAASIEADLAKPASWATPVHCEMEYGCNPSMHSSLQTDERQRAHRAQEPFTPMTSGKTRKQ